EAGFGESFFMHGIDALFGGVDHVFAITVFDGRRRAGLCAGWGLAIDQPVKAHGAFIGGAFVFDVHGIPRVNTVGLGVDGPGITALNDTERTARDTGSAPIANIILDDHGTEFCAIECTGWAHI